MSQIKMHIHVAHVPSHISRKLQKNLQALFEMGWRESTSKPPSNVNNASNSSKIKIKKCEKNLTSRQFLFSKHKHVP